MVQLKVQRSPKAGGGLMQLWIENWIVSSKHELIIYAFMFSPKENEKQTRSFL